MIVSATIRDSCSTASKSIGVDRRPPYALLEANADGHDLALHRVAYDTDAVIRAIFAHHVFPNPEWLVAKFGSSTPVTALS